jgi:ParB-like chromosome segregation protein Spo0J
MWPLDKIHPYARNARQIPAKAIDKVAPSIREFGWRQPIVVDNDGVIIVGHVRLLAAQKLGLKEAPVHVARNLSAAQVCVIVCSITGVMRRPAGMKSRSDWSYSI